MISPYRSSGKEIVVYAPQQTFLKRIATRIKRKYFLFVDQFFIQKRFPKEKCIICNKYSRFNESELWKECGHISNNGLPVMQWSQYRCSTSGGGPR